MAVTKGYWGIDIGQCALKALRLEMIDGKPTATAFDYVEHAKILSQPDADQDLLIREALEKFLSRNSVKTDEVAIGIAGQSGLARFVKLPPVEEKKIAEIVKFEAKQQIPFPLDEVEWDFQKIGGGEAVDGFALETEIGLFAMKRDIISRYLGYFTGSRIEVHLIQMSPLALVNFATYELLKPKVDPLEGEPEEDPIPRGKKRCTVVMDVGTDASNLIITDGAKIIWQRPIPLGGMNFTRALTKELKLTLAKAEHLKRNAAKSPDMASILKAIKPVLTDFVGEVQRSLGYFTNTHRDAHVAHMVGLGSAFKLPGLQKYLADKLSLEVKKPTKFDRLSGDAVLNDPLFQENLLTFPIAYGLALQGLGQARLTTNLLPQGIRVDRIIRSKKPYAAAAAAALLVGLGGMAMGFSGPYAAITDKNIDKGIEMTKSAGSAYSSQESKYNQGVGNSKKKQDETKLIIAGAEERLNWPRLTEVFTASLPRPGENGNLNEEKAKVNTDLPEFDQNKLWRGEGNAGQSAYDWFLRRMSEGVPIENALADANSDYPKALAYVNVETVHTRWITNASAFLTAADEQIQARFNIPIANWMKDDEREKDETKTPPRSKPKAAEGGAWVVEIRGYTDHKGGRRFIEQSLIRNLQRTDVFAKDENKVARYIVGVPDPVKGKVSHAFVYNVWPVYDPQPNLQYAATSYLDGLIGGSGSGTGIGGPGGDGKEGGPPSGLIPGGGSGGPPGLSGSGSGSGSGTEVAALAPTWQGLGTTGTAGAARGNAGLGSAGFAGPGMPGMPGGSTVGSGGGKKVEDTGRTRYEFVVMFLWREPTPSTPPAGSTP
ncbi:Competence protein A [Gemmata sp. SH-PL17]|uniref:type IV pilus assembly protein PilM n=1 Tax=Gemmata sp. SH-PL17 TaxID=1630693 RepID=UPI0004B87ECF|nr:type IV pilus assembly protein PilM [Gemmata sp. SH-PL17]AMV23367.1 Competence protein A [Gemmata sp. SH-PL17]